MFNPYANISKSKGIDLPILKVYLAGRIAGNCIEACLKWRKDIINHYKNYEYNYEINDYDSYPISFLDALNSKESESVDEKGLTSAIPPNLIYDKDLLSIKCADILVCNMDDMLEEGIEDLLKIKSNEKIDDGEIADVFDCNNPNNIPVDFKQAFYKLQDKLKNRRENFGTICEFAIAMYLQKPTILIVPENRKEIYMKHPFAKRASVIVTSTEQLLKEKWIEILYKSIASAIY